MHFDPELYPWFSVGLIAWGLLDCFLGYRVFKVTIALYGAIFGACFGYWVVLTMGLALAGQIVGVVLGAFLGGWLAFLLYLAAVFVAGLSFGFTLGLLLFAKYNPSLALIAGCGLGLICGFIAIKLQKVLLVLATALGGAFRALLAVMYFTHHTDWAYYLFQQPQQIPALVDQTPWLLPATLILAAAGAITQFGLTGNEAPDQKKAATKDRRK